jgi:hypothetical protein
LKFYASESAAPQQRQWIYILQFRREFLDGAKPNDPDPFPDYLPENGLERPNPYGIWLGYRIRTFRGLLCYLTKKRGLHGVGGTGLPTKNEKDVETHGVGGTGLPTKNEKDVETHGVGGTGLLPFASVQFCSNLFKNRKENSCFQFSSHSSLGSEQNRKELKLVE